MNKNTLALYLYTFVYEKKQFILIFLKCDTICLHVK